MRSPSDKTLLTCRISPAPRNQTPVLNQLPHPHRRHPEDLSSLFRSDQAHFRKRCKRRKHMNQLESRGHTPNPAAPWRVPPTWPSVSSPASPSPPTPPPRRTQPTRTSTTARRAPPNRWPHKSDLPGSGRGCFLLADPAHPSPMLDPFHEPKGSSPPPSSPSTTPLFPTRVPFYWSSESPPPKLADNLHEWCRAMPPKPVAPKNTRPIAIDGKLYPND